VGQVPAYFRGFLVDGIQKEHGMVATNTTTTTLIVLPEEQTTKFETEKRQLLSQNTQQSIISLATV
jgi:hypothetical protein